jgi:hypothetical protein
VSSPTPEPVPGQVFGAIEGARDPSQFSLHQGIDQRLMEVASAFDPSELCNPSDFAQLEVDFQPPTSEVERLPPRPTQTAIVKKPALLLSSFGFFEPIENKSMSPARSPSLTLDPYSHRRQIDVGLLKGESRHFSEFVSAVGFPDGSTSAAVYWDYRVQINFFLGTHARQRVLIAWGGLKDTATSPDVDLVIKIRDLGSAIFKVVTHVKGNPPMKLSVLERIKVDRTRLPIFILAQIRTVIDVLDCQGNDPVVESAQQMRLMTEREFYNQYVILACEKALLGGEING